MQPPPTTVNYVAAYVLMASENECSGSSFRIGEVNSPPLC
jgi:hypothetical protein